MPRIYRPPHQSTTHPPLHTHLLYPPPPPSAFSSPRRMTTQVKLSERCFADCINEFRTKTMTDEERACSQKCFQVGGLCALPSSTSIPKQLEPPLPLPQLGLTPHRHLTRHTAPTKTRTMVTEPEPWSPNPHLQKYINATQRMALRWSELSQKAAAASK